MRYDVKKIQYFDTPVWICKNDSLEDDIRTVQSYIRANDNSYNRIVISCMLDPNWCLNIIIKDNSDIPNLVRNILIKETKYIDIISYNNVQNYLAFILTGKRGNMIPGDFIYEPNNNRIKRIK